MDCLQKSPNERPIIAEGSPARFGLSNLSILDQPRVANAASELFESIFAKEKTSARMVVGVASMPLGTPVELEVTLEVAE